MIRRIAEHVVFANERISVREDEVEFGDGQRSTYSLVERRDFVTVLAFENDGFWLVEQYRYPLGRRLWEFVQGGWPVDVPSREPRELAGIELAEETGLRAASWRHLGRIFAAPGGSGQGFDVFLATDLTPGEPQREASEADMVHRWFGRNEITAMIRSGEFADGHSLAALSLFDAVAGTTLS